MIPRLNSIALQQLTTMRDGCAEQLRGLVDHYRIIEATYEDHADETHAAFQRYLRQAIDDARTSPAAELYMVETLILLLAEAVYQLREHQERQAKPHSPRCQYPIGTDPNGRALPCMRVVRDDHCESHGRDHGTGQRDGDAR